MDSSKVKKEVFDPIKENREKFENVLVDKLADIFPTVVKDGQVDFKALLAELGEYVEATERYELNWAGKTEAKHIANSDIVGKTLKYLPEDGKNADTTENLYIEGDNLEVLKLLRHSYFNKIKMIYIDPPYNTGNDFIYNDKFSTSGDAVARAEGDVDDDRNRLVVNQKSSGRYHSNWLSMIYPRLKIAKDLLTDNGVIFISIDDNEVDNLKKVCNEIFGEENFIAQIAVVNNLKGRNDRKHIATCHEYLILYGKLNPETFGLPLTDEQKAEYKYTDNNGNQYALRDLRKRGRPDRREDRPNMYFPIYYNRNTKACSLEKVTDDDIEILPIKGDGSDGRWRWGKERVLANLSILEPRYSSRNNRWDIDHRVYLNQVTNGDEEDGDDTEENSVERTSKAKSFWMGGELSTDVGRRAFKSLMPEVEYDYPKAVEFIKKIIYLGTSNDDFILDFFSGSATTAQAIMEINAVDGGKRKFILVQVPEQCDEKSSTYKAGYKNICDIAKERIRRAGEKLKEDNKDKEGIENLDIGFKVFKVGDTNIRWFSEAIRTDEMTLDESMMSDKDKLDFNPGYTDIDIVYEILLRHRDIPLSTRVEHLPQIGNRTYIFADTVVVCLEENITDEIIDKIAEIEPLPNKIIFRDSAFGSDISLKENAMLRLEADMKKHSGLEKKTYRVEFI